MKQAIKNFRILILVCFAIITKPSFGQGIPGLTLDTMQFLQGYTFNSAPAIRYNTGLQTTPQGNIYISFARAGLAYYTPPINGGSFGTWQLFNKANTNSGLASDSIHCIFYDSLNSNLWIAQSTGITKKNNGSFISYPFNSPYDISTNRINDIVAIGNLVYIGTNQGLVIFNQTNNTWQTFNTTNSNLPNDSINSFYLNSQQFLWICTNNGAIKLNSQGVFSNLIQLPNNIVKFICTNQTDTILASNVGIYKRHKGNLICLDTLVGKYNNSLTQSSGDGERFLCDTINFSPKGFTPPSTPFIIASSPFLCDKNGDIYITLKNNINSCSSCGFGTIYSINSNNLFEVLIKSFNSRSIINSSLSNMNCSNKIVFLKDSICILTSMNSLSSPLQLTGNNIPCLYLAEKKSSNYNSALKNILIINNSFINNPTSYIAGNSSITLNAINNQASPKGQVDLSANSIKSRVLNAGDLHWDPVGQTPYYEFPKGSGKNTIYTSSIWLGGIDSQGALYSAAQTYRQGGSCDFWPGWIATNGQTWAYDNILVASRSEIDQFRQQFLQGNVTNGTFQIPSIIVKWPAQHPSTNTELAPFIDYNNDGNYNPYDGDYPDIKGDQMAWWTFNDVANIKTETSSNPMGLEIHGSAYAYTCNDPSTILGKILQYTTFYHYEVFNKSPQNYNSCYLGMWTDFDLGHAADDLVGCNLNTNSFYAYNGDSLDEGGAGYGLCPPTQNVQFLNAPLAPINDGIDNNHNGTIDEPNENLGLSKFVYYVNTNNIPTGNPNTSDDYYEYLTGKWLDGVPITYGGDGRGIGTGATNSPSSFMFPNTSDPNFTTPWTMSTAGIAPDDMRGIGSTGPFDMPIGSKKTFDLAFFTGPNDLIQNFDLVRKLDSLFDSGALNNYNSYVPITGSSLITNINSNYTYNTLNLGGNTTFAWTVTNGSIISGQGTNQIIVKWNTTGLNTIEVKVNNQQVISPCQQIGSLSVNVESCFNPPINSNNNSHCPGTTLNTISGIGYSYQWYYNGSPIFGANSPSYTTSLEGDYTVRIDSGLCYGVSSTYSLAANTINSTCNLSGSNTFCQGTPVNLYATNGNGYTYQWYRNGTIIPGATTANYPALLAGNYSVRIDSGGCYGISPAQNVSFYSLPNVGISNSTGTVICSGSPVTLNGTGAVSYSWNNGVVNNTTFYPTSTNTYQVIGTDVHGCTNVNSTTISVNGLPSVQSIIGNPSIVPFQNYVYAVNSTPGINFNWLIQGGAIVTGQGTNNVNVIWGSNGPYLLQLVQSNANGCSDTSSLAVINSNCSITYTVQQVGTAPYCQGDSITLSVATAPGTQFQWLLNGAPINNAVTASVTATQSGVYQVQMTQAGCTALSNGNSITFLQAPATPIITASGSGSGCLGGTQSLSCPAGYSSYVWSNGTTTSSTVAINSGNYVVTVTGANGCEATSSPFFVNLSLLSSADICLVSVDDVTNKNVVIWEKPVLTGVDSFYVYKESTSSNVYTKIGSVAANAFSTFTDVSSNPLQRADRYKISILDTCGFESSPSTIHKTIHLSINQGVGNTYNLIWDAYEGFVFGTYYILRGTSPNNLFTIDSIQSNLLSYTDLNPPAGTVYYAVEVRKAIPCNPTARVSSVGYASSRSNIKDNSLTSLNNYENPFTDFSIIPNPATGNTSVHLNLSNTSLTNISVFDMTGRLVQILTNSNLSAGQHTFTWDLNENNAKVKAGVYLIKVSANGFTQTKRVVIL